MNRSAIVLVTIPYAIGDVVQFASSCVDEIHASNCKSVPIVDIICNGKQFELLSLDPRFRRVLAINGNYFPNRNKRSWIHVLFPHPRSLQVALELRKRKYDYIFPGNFAFGFFWIVGSRIMIPHFNEVIEYWLALRRGQRFPIHRIVRDIVHRRLHPGLQGVTSDWQPVLYVDKGHVEEAYEIARDLRSAVRERGDWKTTKLVLINPDSSSGVTRPPTELLSAAVVRVLETDASVVVGILPGFTDRDAAQRLYTRIAPRFEQQVRNLEGALPPDLPLLTAFLHQADVLVTGDTATMHFAAARLLARKGSPSQDADHTGGVQIVAIFGGTCPALYASQDRTVVVGGDRPDQCQIRPGLFKEGYDATGHDFFSHVDPQAVADAISAAL